MSENENTKELVSDERARLLRLLLANEQARQEAGRRIVARPRVQAESMPLSHAQERLWFLDQLGLAGPAYNIKVALRLEGTLDVGALRDSFTALLARHESLRTRLASVDGTPVQIIDEPAPFALNTIDLSAMAEHEQSLEVERLSKEETLRRFDLAAGPLLHVNLLQLGSSEHLLLLTMHHIVSDGWSMSILVRDLSTFYAARVQHAQVALPELSIQYADYVLWQRSLGQSQALEQQLAYWRKQLDGAPATLELPTDRPRPAVASFQGGLLPFVIPETLSQALNELARGKGVTLFMLLLAAFQTLLSRWSGQGDIVVGTSVAGRTHPQTENLIGFFLNALALRTNFASDPTFQQVLAAVKDTALDAYAHQDIPFGTLVAELRPERDLSHQPIFQVLFGLQNTPEEDFSLPGLRLRQVASENVSAKFDLSLFIHERPGALRGAFEYAADLFDRGTVERLIDHFLTLLEGIVRQPSMRISQLALMSEAVRHDVLTRWNDTAQDYPREWCMHELFAAQAVRTPHAVAVICGEQQLSYAELDRRSNQLAHYLIELGVAPEVRVGLCVERSLDMILGLFGILKAGGAYVPLDPSYPQERLSYQLADAGISILLTHSRLESRLPSSWARVICLDQQGPQIDTYSEQAPETTVCPDNLMYLIYTSGSTGKPKGVMVPHRGVVNYLTDMARRFEAHLGSGVPINTPLAFDATITSLYPPLVSGGSIRLVEDGAEVDGLAQMLRSNHDLTLMKLTPSHLQAVQTLLPVEELAGRLRRIVLGGEALKAAAVELWRQHAPQTRLVNHYGPTETVVGCAVHEISTGTAREGVIPIGRPIANVRLYILDGQLQPMPIGVVGELFIGGAGVARGYLNRPGLTAERFVADPFGDGGRLYRTGDRVRYLADGNIEFLGRADHQVKIRGYRIEPGEIEAVLLARPGVKQAVVITRPGASGEQKLAGYVVSEASVSLRTEELREHLRRVLPEYMVPASLMRLETLPLTVNGKLDRKALPEPPATALKDHAAPRTAMQDNLAAIWAPLLGIEQVSADDDFFDLGGHSLLATRVVAQVRELLQIELPLRVLFEAPTLAEFAERIETLRREQRGVSLPPLLPQMRQAKIPLSFAQERLWFLERLGLVGAAYVAPMALRLQGALNWDALERSFTDLRQRHESLRTRFDSEDGLPFQIIDAAGHFSLPMEDLSTLPQAQREDWVQRRMREETQRPFDLSSDAPLRAVVLKVSEQEHVLLLTLHHIASDGWSRGVLVRELSALYASHSQELPVVLPALPVQYADYAIWQRGWLRGEVLQRQLQYWRAQLNGVPDMLQLPTDRPRPAVANFHGAVLPFDLPQSLSMAVTALAQREGMTPYMVLVAALQILLSRWSGRQDIVVGSPIAGRMHKQTEDLIGFFINTLVLRTEVAPALSVQQLLGRVKETTLDAYAHQDLPFEKLVAELQPSRDLSRQPIYQVDFTFQNAPRERLELPGLTLSGVGEHFTTAKLDLSLHLSQTSTGMHGALEYATDLFDRQTMERMVDQYAFMLEQMTENPQCRLDELQLMREPAQRQWLQQLRGQVLSYPQAHCIHESFDLQAIRDPHAIAITHEGEHLSYRQLQKRSNQLAHHLRSLGVGAESVVGVCLERSPQMVVALLAVLKSGAVYLPLDPTHPAERLAYQLHDAQVRVLVTDGTLLEGMPKGLVPVCLDQQAEAIARYPASAPDVTVDPQNLAYIIYTSGSTGQPKGALITHACVMRLFAATEAQYGFSAKDVWTLFHAYTFDFSVWELWGALLYGGRLVVVPYGVSRTPRQFHQLLREEGVTVLNQTPSAFAQLMRTDEDQARLSSLRLVIFGGEALNVSELKPWLKRYGDQRPQLINMYGITETTVHVTYKAVGHGDTQDSASLIGEPLADLQAYVLDDRLQLQPLSVAGELYIGGAGLARGYLHRAGLTAQRFIADPFGSGERLYRTGDLARYRADGSLEYLGRADQQVKIRGYRIELGEIEAALLRQPGVKQAVVVAREDTPGEKRLVGYVTRNRQSSLSIGELREQLRQVLPSYMVPAAVMELEALPLTGNGKVDRKALPTPDLSGQQKRYVAPRNAVEESLAAAWKAVLKLEQVGVEDNFFDVGGDSILALRVQAEAQKRGCAFSLADLFKAQQIDRLALTTLATQASAVQQVATPFGLLSAEDRHKACEAGYEDAYPLSMLQAGMVFHNLWERGSSTYHPVSVHTLDTMLDEAALRAALQVAVDRHPILRTTFHLSGYEVPVQGVHKHALAWLHVEDWSEWDAAEQQRRSNQFVQQEGRHEFDLTQGPLIRFFAHRLSADSFQFTLSAHHAILDGWSDALLLTDVYEAYLAQLEGRALPDKPPLQAHYRDFIAQEQQALRNPVHEQYWLDAVQGDERSLLWRLERTGVAANITTPPRAGASVNGALGQGVVALARELGVSVKSVLFAAHLNVLRVLTGGEGGVTGLVSNARMEAPDADQILGLFLNTVPLRFVPDAAGRWHDLVHAARMLEEQMLAHRCYPVAEIYRRLQGRFEGRHALELVFDYTNFHAYQSLAGRLAVRQTGGMGETNFPLTIHAKFDGKSANGQVAVSYQAERFQAWQAEQILQLYLRTLQVMVAQPHMHYARADLLDPHERQRLLVTWNATAVSYADHSRLDELFGAQAARTPQNVAVRCGEEQLSYAELDQRSTQLAHYLQQHLGVGPEVLVGVCLERSVAMVVGLLGILKAGGAYVPLDPGYPPERLSYLMADASVSILLTHSAVQDRLPSTWARVVALDTQWDAITQSPLTPPVQAHNASNLVYVIYTSGSTGQPKGAMLTHRSVVNYVTWAVQAYHVSEGHGAPVNTPLAFDATVTSLWLPLLAGGTVTLLPEGNEELFALGDLLQTHQRYALVKLTPAHLSVLNEERPQAIAPQATSTLVIGGETLAAAQVARWRQHAPDTRLINEYGPTETTVGCVVHEIGEHDSHQGMVPIGRPIANTKLYVMDRELEAVPIGITGELYIGGAGLARGYLNRPGLTAQRFVANPFGVAERLYRTGDLVRYRTDGTLEFIGRVDTQVKLHGYRIELGEIEAALLTYPAVTQAVAAIREDMPGDKKLVGYLVCRAGHAVPPAELREYLLRSLPSYMVPTLWATLEELPRTPHGKIDRKALPPPQEHSAAKYVEPRNHVERTLAAIWQQVLRIECVGVHDNFFELGGDSIQSIKIVARAASEGLKLTIRQIFDEQTIDRLAPAVENAQVMAVDQGPAEGTVLLTPIQHWFFEGKPQEPHHFNQALLLRSSQPLDARKLRTVVDGLLVHHDALRLTFRGEAGQWQQTYAPHSSPSPAFEHLNLAQSEGQDPLAAMSREAQRLQTSFDLEAGPLLRVALFELGPQHGQRLLLIGHHLAVDGVSWRILFEDLIALYRQLESGEAPQLPLKTHSYKRWAQRLETYPRQEAAASELHYWQSLPWTLAQRLPVDFAAATATQASQQIVKSVLSEPETQALLKEVPQVYRSQINDVLLTALARALTDWSGGDAALIELEGHGREALFDDIDVSRTVGWFTSQFPVLLKLERQPSLESALRSVKEQLRRIPNRGAGYGILKYLDAGKRLQSLPAAQISFNYQGQFDQEAGQDSLLAFADESPGASRSSQGERRCLIDVNGSVVMGRLQLQWIYSDTVHREETIQTLAGNFMQALRQIIAFCHGEEVGLSSYTSSDFPLANIDQTDLETLLASLGETDE
ncbi:MAG: amino acid adenylation domain-containing protein [Rhodanobacter sp.]|jgi:amino acid adenylation domain-containing protein/non-ribosomal peptide synthase protein (TIGR01720 family)